MPGGVEVARVGPSTAGAKVKALPALAKVHYLSSKAAGFARSGY
jgi:hypothetical protein